MRLARLLRDGEAILWPETDSEPGHQRPAMSGVEPGIETVVEEDPGRRQEIPALANFFVPHLCRTPCPAENTLEACPVAAAALPWRRKRR